MEKCSQNDVIRKINLAYFGLTKSGKTTGIAALTSIPEQIVNLALGDSGRTKTTIQYHIDSEWEGDTEEGAIFVEKIELFKSAVMGSIDGAVEEYNLKLEKDPLLKSVFGLNELGEGDDVWDYILEKVGQLENTKISLEKLRDLMCSSNIDNFVKRLTIKVPAEVNIRTFLQNNKLDLFIRDTRGLLDIAIKNHDKEKNLVKPLRELGLENLDGIVFFCDDQYPNVVQEIYRDTFECVFKSVPVFLIGKQDDLYEKFQSTYQQIDIKNVNSFIDSCEMGKKFLKTFKLFEYFKITYADKKKREFLFVDNFFSPREIEFLLPYCGSLTDFSVFGENDNESLMEKEDFLFYRMMAVASGQKVIERICALQKRMETLLKEKIASNYLREMCMSDNWMNRLKTDLDKYDNSYRGSTEYVKPQLDAVTRESLERDLNDPDVHLLGPHDGITTLENNQLKYAITAIMAVTVRRWISDLISEINLLEDLKIPQTGQLLFENLKGDFDTQGALLRKTLRSVLYKKFTDENANIQGYVIADRKKVVAGIEKRRWNKSGATTSSVVEVVQNITEDFCNCVDKQSIDDISGVIKNTNLLKK